jgi:hypothetical protein
MRDRVTFTPLAVLSLDPNENGMQPLLVLCRAPADDGWLVIEASTGFIYNLFDSIAHLYTEWVGTAMHVDLRSARARSALLARSRWWHRPDGYETVGSPLERVA